MANGIPPLLNKINNALNTAALLRADAAVIFGGANISQWGIYLNGSQILQPDSIVSLDFKQDWRVAEYPMEQGAFASYNKVATPYDAKITMTKGGSETDRQAFLDTLEQVSANLELYDVVTPEKIYSNANIEHYDYRRKSSSGAGIIIAELWLIEIRITVPISFTNTRAPSGMSPVNSGAVQSLKPSASQTPSAGTALAGVPNSPNSPWV